MKTLRIDRRIASLLPARFALVAAIGCIAIALSPVLAPVAHGQVLAPGYTFTALGQFNGSNGANLTNDLTASADGTTLYGISSGGPSGAGLIFSISTGGGVIHDVGDLSASGSNGSGIYGSLTPSADRLTMYGMTILGGANNSGTIFSYNVAAGTFATLHSFTYGPDGGNPTTNVTLSGSTLYASDLLTSVVGGWPLNVISIATTGGPVTSLPLSPVPVVPANPPSNSAPIVSGSTIYSYGAIGGGAWDVFSTGTAGGAVNVIHTFSGGAAGSAPCGTMVLSGSTLYGMTNAGGASGNGNVYSINLTTGAYTNLYSFSGGTDGAVPIGSLTLIGAKLYGTTQGNNDWNGYTNVNEYGNIFSINANGTGFRNLYSFSASGQPDGNSPGGSLTVIGSTFYGITQFGGNAADNGNSSGAGTIFALTPNGINGNWAAGSGTWSGTGNWSGNVPPAAYALDTAVFGPALSSGAATVTMDANNSLSSLGLGTTGTNSYVISGTNTLTLSNTGGAAATITNSGGSHTLAVPVWLGSNLSVTATPGSTLTVSGAIGEIYPGMALAVSGGGTLILSGNSGYTGGTTVNASTLEIGNGGTGEALSSSGGITMSNSATVEFNHTDTLAYAGAISGSGQFVKAGSGSLTLNGAGSYTGATTISAGTLVLGGSDLPTTTALNIAAVAVLDMGGNSQTVGSLSGAAGAIIANNLVHPSHTYTSSLTVNPTSGATTFAGNIVRLDAVERPRQRGVDDVRQRRIGPQRGEQLQRRDDDQRRHAGDRRRHCLARQRVGVDQRRGAAGFGERLWDWRIACGLVPSRFGRGCPQRGGVNAGDDRRI